MSFLLHFISCDFVNVADAIDSLLIFIAGVLAGLDPQNWIPWSKSAGGSGLPEVQILKRICNSAATPGPF